MGAGKGSLAALVLNSDLEENETVVAGTFFFPAFIVLWKEEIK